MKHVTFAIYVLLLPVTYTIAIVVVSVNDLITIIEDQVSHAGDNW